ncbi:MAG: carbohydrate binding domain-containing protein [Phycisphaerales bacterium]|nr:MAG: carbohydrate binding domain-containing protein [Phycisphaerales bacterium]
MRHRVVWLTAFLLVGFTGLSPSHAQVVENLLENGGFESGQMTPWGIWGDQTGEVVTDCVGAVVPEGPIEGDYCLHVTTNSPGPENNWDYGFNHGGHVFEAGKKYTLSVFLKCKEGELQIRLKPERGADPWEGYGEVVVTMTEEWEEYTTTTPVFSEDVDPGSITFHTAFAAGEFWVDYVRWYEGDYVAPPFGKAQNPSPEDGSVLEQDFANLAWTPGNAAVSHDIYFGEDFDTVNQATRASEVYRHNQPAALGAWYIVGFPTYPYPDRLDLGKTYYWRIDEINDLNPESPWKGDVWSFTVPPLEAYNPVPADGAKFVDTTPVLSWSKGYEAAMHFPYFGDDYDTVNNIPADPPTAIPHGTTTYTPPAAPLEYDKTYYWRVDEWDEGSVIHKGNVWSFTVTREGGGVKGAYYHWSGNSPPTPPSNAFSEHVMTRLDPGIDFNWSGSPEPDVVNEDNFAVIWTGELEVAFAEPYTFYTVSDDGVKLWVNGQLLVDNWTDHGSTRNRASVDLNLVPGQRYPVVMHFYENGGGAIAQLLWKSPSTPEQVVPAGALSPPRSASSPVPAHGSTGVTDSPTLEWSAGDKAVQHDVYFGTDQAAVAAADTTTAGIYRGRQGLAATSYVPPENPLVWDATYYWRVDEVNGVDMWKGSVWNFTTANYIIVDDFEDYNNYSPHRIFQTWLDGWGYTDPPPGREGNGTGSTIGYLTAPFAEQTIVHGGGQSMPYGFDLTAFPFYAEAEREFTFAQNFTRKGVKSLSLWVYGDPNSAAAPLYVGLQDSAGTRIDVPDTSTSRVQTTSWQEVNFELSKFAPVNLMSVKKIYIGVGNRLSPSIGGTGNLFVDDVRLYGPRCVASLAKPANDLNDDCVVDYLDLDIVVNEWLTSGLLVTPSNPGTSGLVAYYPLDGNTNDTAGGHNGVPNGGPVYGPGQVGQALRLDGVDDHVIIDSVGISGSAPRTIACWAKANSTAIADWTDIFGFSGPATDGQHFDFQIVGATGGTTQGWFGLHVHGWERDILPNDLDWHHLAASHDGTTARWYGDGRLIGSGAIAIDSPGGVRMGKREDNDNYFPGLVDEARIFNRVLSDGEVASLAGLTAPFSAVTDLNVDGAVDLGDYAVLGDAWLEEVLWPAP